MAAYKHVFSLANSGAVTLNASAKWASSRWIATDFIAAERAGSYRTFDFDATYTSADERYLIGAYVRNIGNEAYYTGGFEQPFVPGLFAANIGAPRTYGVRVRIGFGAQ